MSHDVRRPPTILLLASNGVASALRLLLMFRRLYFHPPGKAIMSALNHSDPKRLCFDHQDKMVCYEVRNRVPFLDSARPGADVSAQLREHGVSEAKLREFLANWISVESAVESVLLKYRSEAFALFIMADVASDREFADLQIGLDPVRQFFGANRVVISVIDGDQREAPTFFDAIAFDRPPLKGDAAA